MQNAAAGAPRVSVVVPVYNGAAFIREALDSILGQSRPPAEVVVVDDGSTDETPAVVAAYAPAGVRFVQQQRQGPSAARNRGLAETGGELVAFLDADDIWAPEKLARQVAHLAAHPEHGAVTCATVRWNVERGTSQTIARPAPRAADQPRAIAVANFVGNTSHVLARRSVLEACGGFDARLRWSEDWDMWIRMIQVSPFGSVDEPLLVYRWHRGGNANHRRYERSKVVFAVARSAIRHVTPAWRRPPLLAHAWSLAELQRAQYAIEHGLSRRTQLSHSIQALVCSPLDRTGTKLGCVAQALIGRASYDALRRRLGRRPAASAQPQ